MRNGWRMTGRLAALLIALMMIAVPAAAAVVTQNFMRADVTNNAACFTKTAGADAATPFLSFDGTQTIAAAPGVDLIQERITVNGYEGDRMIYTDAVQFSNTCGTDLTVQLRAEADAAGNPVVSGLAGFRVEISLWDAGAGAWSTPMVVENGAVVTATTGTVTLANGTSIPARIVVDTDDLGGTAGTLRWTAEATA